MGSASGLSLSLVRLCLVIFLRLSVVSSGDRVGDTVPFSVPMAQLLSSQGRHRLGPSPHCGDRAAWPSKARGPSRPGSDLGAAHVYLDATLGTSNLSESKFLRVQTRALKNDTCPAGGPQVQGLPGRPEHAGARSSIPGRLVVKPRILPVLGLLLCVPATQRPHESRPWGPAKSG